jgi:hypothetical protein
MPTAHGERRHERAVVNQAQEMEGCAGGCCLPDILQPSGGTGSAPFSLRQFARYGYDVLGRRRGRAQWRDIADHCGWVKAYTAPGRDDRNIHIGFPVPLGINDIDRHEISYIPHYNVAIVPAFSDCASRVETLALDWYHLVRTLAPDLFVSDDGH